MVRRGGPLEINKITFLIVASAFITITLIARLFYLQVISHSYYEELATREQYGFIELPAQRGEIVMKDYHSGEEFLLATNTTLNLLFIDPALVKDPVFIADKISPLIFDLEEERAADNERISEAARKIPIDMTEEEKAELLRPLPDAELEENFRKDLIEKISSKQRQEVILRTDMEPEMGAKLKALNVGGIEVIEEKVYAYPPMISNPSYVASEIADYVEIPSKKLSQILKGENRYVVLARRLHPDTSDAINALIDEDENGLYKGIGFQEEYFRYYPEGSLGANIVGYVSRDNIGQYGIESSFNTDLQGVAGKFQTKRDSVGRQITVGDSVLEPAVDGDDIVLTIDRSVQLEVEKILAHAVWAFQADSGQVIVQNPQTGAIIAMAHAPSFDPNNYGEVFKKVEVNLTPEELANLFPSNDEGIYYFYKNEITLDRYLVFEEKDDNGNSRFYRYENFVGPEVYHNKIVSWPYEPGSVFKSIAMAAAIDDGDVTPNTTFNDAGPIGVDWNVYSEEYDFEIKNSDGYFGLVNMSTVIAESLNTGMTFIAKKMGGALFYSYLDKFGFLDRTDIEFDSEAVGKVEYFEDWTESELATHAFGQGITVTMIQLANAYSAVINGGVLMQPYIVEEVRHDDKSITTTEPHEIRRVISEDTSTKMVQMLVNSVENGVANAAGIHNHYVGGKTGTSQTYKHGVALSGSGTTIATFAGFGPIDDPQFLILVKFDRPRSSEWGSSTAAPIFNQIATYLFDYYNIAPDK